MRMTRNIGNAPGPCEEARCGCGSLLARVVEGAVELKCRRCKAVWRVALAPDPDHPEAGGPKTRSPAAAPPRAASRAVR
jgi:phage FluMu protein Com